MKKKCPFCGFENILGVDRCDNCSRYLTQEDVPKPGKEKLQKLIMTEKVSRFFAKEAPLLVTPDTLISEVIATMHQFPKKGCVLICGPDGKLLGIASIRDILVKVAGVMKDPSKHKISEIMTHNPETLDQDAALSFALHKMSIGKFRHVPVVADGKPIGVVSTRDIIEYLSSKEKK